MSTSVRPRPTPMPVFEPSTDFPTVEDEVVCPHRRPWALVAIAAIAALVVGLLGGFALGRSTAPASVPGPCLAAIETAEDAFTAAIAQFGTMEAGALTAMEEMTETGSLVQDARLGQTEIQRFRTAFSSAAAACRSS